LENLRPWREIPHFGLKFQNLARDDNATLMFCFMAFDCRPLDGLSMSHDDEIWKIIGAFAIVCALLSTMIMTL
jgi:hypothetical protein